MHDTSDSNSLPSAVDDCARAVAESWQQSADKALHPALHWLDKDGSQELRETVYGSGDYKKPWHYAIKFYADRWA